MAWSCVEDRTADGQFGRVLRKIVFDDIYADRTALLSRHPIPLHSLAQLKVTKSQKTCNFDTAIIFILTVLVGMAGGGGDGGGVHFFQIED